MTPLVPSPATPSPHPPPLCQHYETALRLSSGRCARALRALAVRRFQEDKFGETVSYLQRALALYAVDPPSWFLLGCAAIRDQQLDVALSAFIRVLQLDPEHAEAWANASAVLAKSNRHREALGAVKQALRIRGAVLPRHRAGPRPP